jgi:hypothetical protein
MSPALRRIHRQLIFILSRYFVSVAAPEKARQVALSKRWNAAMGCRTDEVALALLAQLTELQHRNIGETSEGQVDNILATTTAKIAELAGIAPLITWTPRISRTASPSSLVGGRVRPATARTHGQRN